MKSIPNLTRKPFQALTLMLSVAALPLLLGGTGCATGSHSEQSSGERSDDLATSSRVKAALAEDTQYKYGSVDVETFKGRVQLSGSVNSRDQKNRAEDLIKNVSGVKEVANNILVQESAN